jgi:hypothetical protein
MEFAGAVELSDSLKHLRRTLEMGKLAQRTQMSQGGCRKLFINFLAIIDGLFLKVQNGARGLDTLF